MISSLSSCFDPKSCAALVGRCLLKQYLEVPNWSLNLQTGRRGPLRSQFVTSETRELYVKTTADRGKWTVVSGKNAKLVFLFATRHWSLVTRHSLCPLDSCVTRRSNPAYPEGPRSVVGSADLFNKSAAFRFTRKRPQSYRRTLRHQL